MLKLLLLGVMLFTPSVFASTACLDCNMIPTIRIFETDGFFQIVCSIFIAIHITFIYWCFKAWSEHKVIMSKVCSSLFLILWTALSYGSYIYVHSYVFYTALTIAIFLSICSDFKRQEDKPSKKAYILIVLYLCSVFSLHFLGHHYAEERIEMLNPK